MSFGSNSVGMGSRVVAEIFPHCHSMASGAIAQFPLSLSIVCSFYFILFIFYSCSILLLLVVILVLCLGLCSF